APPPVAPPPAAYRSVMIAPPPPPPQPSVVEYPTGRYELQGDGMTAPFRWVWVPAVPPPPPAPPPGPPIYAPPPGGGTSSPAPRSQLYRWIDEEGVVHLTDNLETVPERYRAQAKRPS